MSFLTTDYSDLQDNTFGPLPEGDYELVIKQADLRSSKAGREYMNFQMVVRNDLDKVPELEKTNAKYHNRVLFASIFTDKETNKYNTDDLMYYLKAAQVPEGTQFNDIQQFMDTLVGKPIRARVTQSENTYQGETTIQNNVWPNRVSESKYPEVNHQFKDKDKTDPFSNDQQTEKQLDNLPF